MSAQLTDLVRHEAEKRVKTIARRIVRESPQLAALPQEELERLVRLVVLESLRDDLRKAADAERLDYRGERYRFLASRRSAHTSRVYKRGLDRLEEYAASLGIPVVGLTPAQVDDWVSGLAGAPESVGSYVTACSAFFSWLEHRVRDASNRPKFLNPFRWTPARPKRAQVRELAVPTSAEVAAMLAASEGVMRGAVIVCSRLGLRVGALPSLSIKGGRWIATAKGRQQSGEISEEVRQGLEKAGLPLRGPFEGLTSSRLSDRFRMLIKKTGGQLIKKTGEPKYSINDLRNYFAVTLYDECHDINRVSRALGHAGVAVTEKYLRSLGQI